MGMTRNEGHHLKLDLEERLDKIEASITRLVKYAPGIVKYYHIQFQDRLKTFLDGTVEPDGARLTNEVAVFTDKASVKN